MIQAAPFYSTGGFCLVKEKEQSEVTKYSKKPNKQSETQKEQTGTHLSNYKLVGKGQEKDLSKINLKGQGKVAPLCAHQQQQEMEGKKVLSYFLFLSIVRQMKR